MTAKEHHDIAMGLIVEAASLRNSAFFHERTAALMTEDDPSRSVLLRSAAQLAYECCEYAESESLIKIAMEGAPPGDIVGELIRLRVLVEAARNRDQT